MTSKISLSCEPQQVCCQIARSSRAMTHILKSRRFSVNILPCVGEPVRCRC
ncbi:MAG: flavin reductase [Spirochaetaceae bacterium]|nr:flavin reductase [Spirochaetaceae bacterium]